MTDALQRLLRRLQYLTMRGRVALVDDTGPTQTVQADFGNGWRQDKLPRLAEYGFQSSPPADADAMVLFPGGDVTEGIVIATGHRTYRLKLDAGEVAISDDKGQKVYLKATGIVIETPEEVTITATKTTFTGQVWMNGKRVDQTHTHSGVQTGGGNSGAVT